MKTFPTARQPLTDSAIILTFQNIVCEFMFPLVESRVQPTDRRHISC